MKECKYGVFSLRDAFCGLGIGGGTVIVFHSSLMNIGCPDGVLISDYPAWLTTEVLDCIGPRGAIAVPAGNWDYGLKRLRFNVQTTPVAKDLGVLGKYFITRKDVVRTPNPPFSLAVVGGKAKWLCSGQNGHSFGFDSAWDRLFQSGAKMVFFGCGLENMTFVRYMEMRFGVPYLYNKYFSDAVIDSGKTLDQPVIALVRYEYIPLSYNLARFEEDMRLSGIIKEVELGESTVKAIDMSQCFAFGMECLKKDVHYFLERVPEYPCDMIPRK